MRFRELLVLVGSVRNAPLIQMVVQHLSADLPCLSKFSDPSAFRVLEDKLVDFVWFKPILKFPLACGRRGILMGLIKLKSDYVLTGRTVDLLDSLSGFEAHEHSRQGHQIRHFKTDGESSLFFSVGIFSFFLICPDGFCTHCYTAERHQVNMLWL